MIKGRTLDKVELGEKRNNEELSKSNKKIRISKYEPNKNNLGSNNEVKWCVKMHKEAFWAMQRRNGMLQVWKACSLF